MDDKKSKDLKYTIELMKKYSRTLREKKFYVSDFIIALLQLSFAQFNIFSKYGYTHNDINSGNILFSSSKENKSFTYKYFIPNYFEPEDLIFDKKQNDAKNAKNSKDEQKKYCKIESNSEYVISDFDHIHIADEDFFNGDIDDIVYMESLHKNILDTIKMLIKNVKYEKISEEMNKIFDNYYDMEYDKMLNEYIEIMKFYSKNIKKYSKDKNKCFEEVKRFRKKTIRPVEKFVYGYYKLIKKEYPNIFNHK